MTLWNKGKPKQKSHGLAEGLDPEALDWDSIRSKSLFELVKIDKSYLKKSSDDHSFEAQVVQHKDVPVENLPTQDLLEILKSLRQDIFSLRDTNMEHYSALMALVTRHHIDNVIASSAGLDANIADVEGVKYKFSYDTDKLSSTPNLRRNTYSIAESLSELALLSGHYPHGGALEQITEKIQSAFQGANIRETRSGYVIEFAKGSASPDQLGERLSNATSLLSTEFGITVLPVNNMIQIPKEDFLGKKIPRSLEFQLENMVAEQRDKGRAHA